MEEDKNYLKKFNLITWRSLNMNFSSYLSNRREVVLRLSFLGIIVSFVLSANRLCGVKIVNGLKNEIIEINLISDVNCDDIEVSLTGNLRCSGKGPWHFDIPKGTKIKPGEMISIKNELTNNYSFDSKEPLFKNIRINFTWKERNHEFLIRNITQRKRSGLLCGSIGLIFLRPESKKEVADHHIIGQIEGKDYRLDMLSVLLCLLEVEKKKVDQSI